MVEYIEHVCTPLHSTVLKFANLIHVFEIESKAKSFYYIFKNKICMYVQNWPRCQTDRTSPKIINKTIQLISMTFSSTASW